MEREAESQPRAQCGFRHLHLSYFSHTSPFIVVSSNVNMVCPGPYSNEIRLRPAFFFFFSPEIIPGMV